MAMNINLHAFKAAIGTIRLASAAGGLLYVSLPGESISSMKGRLRKLIPDVRFVDGDKVCHRAEKQIREYLAGKRQIFDLPFELSGTLFQRKALRAVARIPYGRTRTYGQVAGSIGHPGSARAVGSANARNNLPLIVPCHRVVAATGLGVYYGGPKLKAWLLRLENADASN